MTSPGGLLNSLLHFSDPYLPLANSMTSKPTQMQAQASGLPSPSENTGEHGVSSPVGRLWTRSETSAGQKRSVSSSSSGQSQGLDTLADTLRSTVITKASLKDGGISGARTLPQTEFFVESTTSLNHLTTPSPFIQKQPSRPSFQRHLPSSQLHVTRVPASS